MWIEIMARLQMRADQQNDFRVCVIRAGPIETHPELITFATTRRADVCVRVVTIDTPRREDALSKTVFTRPADVIHDLLSTVFDDRFANARGERVECFVPGRAFPLSFAAFASAFEWIKNAIRICYLVECGRTFGTVATARAWMFRIAFELLHFPRDFVDVSKQTAG